MDSSRDYLEYRSLKSLSKLKKDVKEDDEFDKRDNFKNAGDKAFIEGKYKEAYDNYCEALVLDENNYDIITCKIGAALSLGFIDDVFSSSDMLIKLSSQKPQGYFLKGIAYDAVFQFEKAISYYMDALKLERENQNVVIKSIKQTVAKLVNQLEILNEESIDDIGTLLKMTDILVINKKYNIANIILKYFQSLNNDNRELRLIMFKNFGKIFKVEQKFDKAIIAFEEAFYLACVLEQLQTKIEIIACMTSCYLKLENMPKVIVYYHKLLDMEADLKKVSKEILDENMSLNLRLAIRQNLFTANLRLGKLQTCCECFNDLIKIVDENIDTISNNELYDELIVTKFNTAIELSKLYIIEKEYFVLDNLLRSHLKFIDEIENKNNVLKEKIVIFQIKLIAYLGLCAAGLCQMRFSKLCIKKAMNKLEKQFKFLENSADSETKEANLKQLSILQVEFLLIASDTCAKRVEIRREMNNYDEHRSHDDIEEVKFDENCNQNDCELRIQFAKEAFLKSRTIIDPNLRIQTTHTLGLSLYDNHYYQSASYYFDETLSISKTMLRINNNNNLNPQPDNEEFNLNDALPDYHLESTVYWISCQILTRFTRKSLNENEAEKRKTREELESLLNKSLKAYSKLESSIKLQKLNRLKNLNYITHLTKFKTNSDKDLSDRWKILIDLCVDCLIFLNYKLENYQDCVFYFENSQYLINMDADYISHHLQYYYSPTKPSTTSFSVSADSNIDTETDEVHRSSQDERQNEIKTNFNTFNDLQTMINEANVPVIIYRFIFNCKFLYTFIIEPDNGVVYQNELKLKDIEIVKHILESNDQNTVLSSLFSNEINLIIHKFNLYQNSFIKINLNKIENRNLPSKYQNLLNTRISNYKRDKRFREYIHAAVAKPEGQKRQGNNRNTISSKHNYSLPQNTIDELIPTTVASTINDNDIEISDIDIETFKIDYHQLLNDVESRNNNLADTKSETNSAVLKNGTKQLILKMLKEIFLKPLRLKINNYYCEHKVINFCTSYQYVKILVYVLNVCSINESDYRIPNYLCSIESVYLLLNAAHISSKREREDEINLELMRDAIVNGPERVKNISINPTVLRIDKENIKPSMTSNPRLAVNLINQNPEDPFICVDNSQYIKIMQRYDQSISTLISETVTKTNVKRSNLEILNYYQLNDETFKTYSIGCPSLPMKFEILNASKKTFLANGFEELNTCSKIMYCEPVFAEHATKLEFLTQLTHSTVVHITTFSSNDLDSYLVFSVSNDIQPHLHEETEKYCVISCDDLNSVYLDKCKLIVLSCYSLKYHQPRFELAKKLLKRGCRSILLILTPIPNNILLEFYKIFYTNIKKNQYLSVAYMNAINELIKNKNIDENNYDLIISSMCLISSSSIEISLDEIGKNMIQLKIDNSLDKYKFTNSKRNLLNYEPKENFMGIYTDLEKVLIQLQMEIKMLLSELIIILTKKVLNDYISFKDICIYLANLISKSIDYSKHEKVEPEALLNLINKNKAAVNILTCLGFNFQTSSVEPSSVEEAKNDSILLSYNKAFITFPNSRFLDLNLRMTHVISSINDLCFYNNTLTPLASESGTEITESSSTIQVQNTAESFLEQLSTTYATAISNFHALLPIEDKKLLSCLIDILALTKFSPEILLSITDFSVDYVINYYKKKNVEIRDNLTRASARSLYASSMDFNYLSSTSAGRKSNIYSKNQELRKYQKIDISNKVINFLYSIGYEIIGLWLRFQDIALNRQLLDHMLKILTSFSTDRDMSLYRELNVSVLGQRSANQKLFPSDAKIYSLNPVILPNSNISMIAPWGNVVETQEEMIKKIRFTDKYMALTKRRSNQRIDVLKHHLNYAAQQRMKNESVILTSRRSALDNSIDINNNNNNNNNQLNKINNKEKLKYYSGGNPIKDRKIVNEKIPLPIEQIDQIREYSHYLCRKRLDKIEIEHNEKLEKLVLPYIANNFK